MPDIFRRLLLALALACSALVLVQVPAHACRCAAAPLARQVERADVVLTGTVRAVDETGRTTTYRMAVDRVYRGGVEQRSVEVVSRDTSCGLRLRQGEIYVLLARQAGAALRATRCDGTARATPELVRRVERLLGGGRPAVVAEPAAPTFTKVQDGAPPQFTRVAAPGAALVLVGLLGLLVLRRRG